MKIPQAFPRILQIILSVVLAVFLFNTCSDVLQPKQKPSGLSVQLGDEEIFINNAVDFSVQVVDDNGEPLANIPTWADTALTPEDAVEIRGDKLLALKPGRKQLRLRIAGFSESISLLIWPRLHITQSSQPLSGSAEIVASREGAVRLFLKGDERNIAQGDISVKVFQNGTPVETLEFSAQNLTLTSLSDSVSTLEFFIPESHIQPGLSVLIQSESGVTYPESGNPFTVNVASVPEFHIRFIPIHVAATGKTGQVHSGNVDEYMESLLDMFPINEYVTDIHAPVTVDISPSGDLYAGVLNIVRNIWVSEGRPNYYYFAVMPEPEDQGNGLYTLGIACYFCRQAVGFDNELTIFKNHPYVSASLTMTHELGHNMGRQHAPCGEGQAQPAGVDPNYPYSSGSIGVYGYESDEDELKSPAVFSDIMSYCYPKWVSDYTYKEILNFRLQDNNQADASGRDVLLVSGSMSSNGLSLDPAFRITAPPSLPKKSGLYTLSGYDKNGRQLFSISFSGHRVIDVPHNLRTFTFAIPVERVHIKKLETLRLTGRSLSAEQRASVPAYQPQAKILPNISARRIGTKEVSLKWSSSRYKMTMVKNMQTGEVIGFTSGGVSKIKTDAKKLKLYFSDGVHTTTATIAVQ